MLQLNETVEEIENEIAKLENELDCGEYTRYEYDDVRDDIQEAVKKYNEGIITRGEAQIRICANKRFIKKEKKKAEDLNLNGKELSHYNTLRDYGVDADIAKIYAQDIHKFIMDFADTEGWTERKQLLDDAFYSLFDKIENVWNLDVEDSYNLSEEIIREYAK